MSDADRMVIDPLISPREAAVILGINYATLTKWARADLIDFVMMPNGRRRYKESVLRAILENGVKSS